MSVPRELTWSRDPHTEAKHRVLRGYLDAWWPILLDGYRQVTYAEGYAGPGEYKDGEDGSPVVALRSLLEHEAPLNLMRRQVNVALVEQREDRLDNCVEQIHQRLGPLPAQVTLYPQPGACEDQLLPLLDRIGAWGSPVLVNLDPWGAGVPYRVVRRVAENISSEVVVSFMAQWFTRWADNEELEQGDIQFGNRDWREVAHVPSDEKRRWLVDKYRERLRDAGFQYTAWFELVDEGGNAFFMVFATSSRLGLERMKESFWRVDPVRGVHFRDPRDPAQMMFDVDDDPYLASLRNLLAEQLEGRTKVPVQELRDWTLEETVFRPPHAMAVLQRWKDEGRLTPDPPGRILTSGRVTLHARPPVEREPPSEQESLF